MDVTTLPAPIYFVYEGTISVGGLRVNYTSVKHDTESRQCSSLLKEAVMGNNRTDNHEGLLHWLINPHQG